jgi:hypothetical protein
MWARTYFKGRKHLPRDAWRSARYIGGTQGGYIHDTDYVAKLQKARDEARDFRWKNQELTEE